MITLTPVNPPIVIPRRGGNFRFDSELENLTDQPRTVDIWTIARLPNNNEYGPILMFNNFTIPAYYVIHPRTMTQSVPGFAPPGDYRYIARVGDYPESVISESSFDFFKSAVADGATGIDSWAVEGDLIDQAGDLSFESQDFVLGPAYPNPFNSVVTVSIQLPVSANVEIVVYNIYGQVVEASLLQVTPTGSCVYELRADNLTSGLYFIEASTSSGWSDVRKVMLIR